jgi:hypothetical protein
MTGYTHTCASCDAQMNVHERYVGRVLRCTACGTEFLADPTLIDIEDLLPERDRRSGRWLAAGLMVVVAGAFAWWLGQAGHGGVFSDWFRPRKGAGQMAVLALGSGEPVPAALDQETVGIVVSAIENPDPGALQLLRVQGRLIDVTQGTTVTIIQVVRRDRAARVRILVGPWTSRVVWVPAAALR